MSREKSRATELDRFIGARIKTARESKRLSQQNIGDDIGLTYQAVQKYESGKDRISASRLWQISQSIGCDVAFFFEEMPGSIRAQFQPPSARPRIGILQIGRQA